MSKLLVDSEMSSSFSLFILVTRASVALDCISLISLILGKLSNCFNLFRMPGISYRMLVAQIGESAKATSRSSLIFASVICLVRDSGKVDWNILFS